MSLSQFVKGVFRPMHNAEGAPDISSEELRKANARKEVQASETRMDGAKAISLEDEKPDELDYEARNLSIIRHANELTKQTLKQLEGITSKEERITMINQACGALQDIINSVEDDPKMRQARENIDRMKSELNLVE